MKRDSNPHDLKNTDYTLAVNMTTSSESGDEMTIQLEPSNYYGVKFLIGYKVIGFKTDLLKERTYYFLINTEEVNPLNINYKRSSIGYVDNSKVLNNDFNNTLNSQDCGDCNQVNVLNKPLEEIIQTPSQNYVELVHDRCITLVDLEDKGLNFNINFPIKKIEINQEKLGTTLYWDDYRNVSRLLNVTDIEEKSTQSYIYEVFQPCDDSTYQTCLNVDRLRLLPKYNRLILDPSEQQTGGNLKMGTYEFWASYCDLMGNEMSEYCTPTNPISIWDENNNIQAQTETDEFTNFAIKIKVRNLDVNNFKYYKVAVVERNTVANTQSVFLAGIYPTSDDTILYTHSGSSNDDLYISRGNVSIKKRMDFQTLTAIKPQWEKAKGTMVSGDTLFHYGLVQKEELNLQPVFNLFGSLLHAQTSACSEDLYKSAIATSKYKFYPRNEVISVGIRLLYKDGDYSATFPLIARPALSGENDIVQLTDVNYNSIKDNTSCITNTRNKKWQIYNTAIPYDTLCRNISDGASVSFSDVFKTCTRQNVAILPAGQVLITDVENYLSLEDELNKNSALIPTLQTALVATYPGLNCPTPPVFYGACTLPAVLVSETNEIGQITNEVSIIEDEEDFLKYQKSVSPPDNFCTSYKKNSAGDNIIDTTMTPFVSCNNKVFLREGSFNNEDCAFATEVNNAVDTTQFGGSNVYLNHAGNTVQTNLQTSLNVNPSTIISDFTNKLHKKAQFFRVKKNGRNKLILEITKGTTCNKLDDLQLDDKIRYTIYDSCTSFNVLGGKIVDLNAGDLSILDVTTYPNEFIVAIDSPIKSETIIDCGAISSTVFKVTPPCGCFSIYTRDLKVKHVKVTYDSIAIDKTQKYKSNCRFEIPRVNDCDPIPYRKYQTAYWESTEEYDNNKELWDSSAIKIKSQDLSDLLLTDRKEFLDYYVQGGSLLPQLDNKGNYITIGTDFKCKPIRHFKMPDNTTAPYIIDNINFKNNADSIIFPLGLELDSKVVRTAIQIAFTNGLITKKQRDNIQGFEIMRGDNSLSKSVIASGIGFDMYNYEKEGDTIHYPNFPFNDLGKNKFLLKEKFGNDLLDHPQNSDSNYLYSFISPDLFLTRPSIPTELTLQGYVVGATKQQFTASDEHSEWTVLGGRARRVATTLAIAEFALESAITLASIVKEGTAGIGSTNFGWITASVAYGFAKIAGGFVEIGKNRFEWLKIFRDLGRTYNFAAMQVGAADYNKLLKVDQYSNDYLRKLTIRKYLKDGYFTYVDENNGQELKVNNKVRETSTLLSTGKDFSLVYNPIYKTIDNNKLSSNSSNFVASEVGGVENKEFTRNVASPYFTLKNYIPDQWGTIGSIKWLTTNYIFDINEPIACKTIFGGTHVISRFSWRRKVPIFTKNAIKHPDKQPFMYSRYDNIGHPRFYCDYELTDGDGMYTGGIAKLPFPDISSDYNFDSQIGVGSMYLKPPSKFYTSVHGIVDFLVESEINCNFRYAGKEKKDWFYPQAQDLRDWLQEATLPLSEPNTFKYNNTYTNPVSNTPFKTLDRTYSKELWKKRVEQPNAVVWSQKEVNENDLTNPWQVYMPLNWYEFKTNAGELIDLHNIESNQFLSRFENKYFVHNSIDNISERLTPENKVLGTSSMFLQRPLEQKSTELGFAGTQNTDIISTPYGHFWCDAKRGKIFKIDQNGQNLEVLSENIQGNPSGMKNWFREHLPFKILKYLPNIDIDNKFKGLGLNMWWDDRQDRLFITKRDYTLKTTTCLKVDPILGLYEDCSSNVVSCPSGYTFNNITNKCELTTTITLCPIGYTYNSVTKTCTLIETLPLKPTPNVIATPSSAIITSGQPFTINLTSNLVGTIFNWTVVSTGVTGATNGSGSVISQTLTGGGTTVYTITPSLDGCTGTPITSTITVTNIPVCPDRRVVFQICNSNSVKDDNFDILLNGTKIGAVDLNSNSQVGSIFIADLDPNLSVTGNDFVCPISNMVVYRFNPNLLQPTNVISMVNTQLNNTGNAGTVGIRNYLLIGNTLSAPCVISNLPYAGANGASFTLNFNYTNCCS